MSLDEISAVYNSKYEKDKEKWEQTRLICFYSLVAANGTKHFKKPSDLFFFSWEKKTKSKALTKDELMAKLKDHGRTH
jgi:hypothetical protein